MELQAVVRVLEAGGVASVRCRRGLVLFAAKCGPRTEPRVSFRPSFW